MNSIKIISVSDKGFTCFSGYKIVLQSIGVLFPAACGDRIDKNHLVNTPPLGAGMVYFKKYRLPVFSSQRSVRVELERVFAG